MLGLAKGLDPARFQPMLATTAADSLATHFEASGFETFVFPFRFFVRWRPWNYYVTGVGSLRRFLRRFDISLVHTNCEESIAPAIRAAAPLALPVVSHIRDMDRGWFRPHVRNALSKGAATIVASGTMRDYCASRGLDASKLRTVYNGVDLSCFSGQQHYRRAGIRQELGIQEHEITIGFIGQLASQKGIEDLITAISDARLRELPLRLVVVGEDWAHGGRFKRRLEDQVDRLGLGGRVAFLGQSSRVPELLTGFDLLAAPFRREAFGRVIIEAMAASVPVVAYPCRAIEELSENGRNALLAEAESPAALAAAIDRASRDHELRRRLIDNGRRRARDFTVERHVSTMERIYDELTEPGVERQGRTA